MLLCKGEAPVHKLISILLLFPLLGNSTDELVIWNVGQGQWVTEIQNENCLHYDMGGENSPQKYVLANCRGKANYLFISHLDWDHISFINAFQYANKYLCLVKKPITEFAKKKSLDFITKVKLCPEAEPLKSNILYDGKLSKYSNQTSAVFYSRKFSALFPGDSPKSVESKWNYNLPIVKILLLGHHGSRTSTAKSTLSNMPNLQVAISSARKQKYGHPHQEVVDQLASKKIPLLKTEDWGNIHFLK